MDKAAFEFSMVSVAKRQWGCGRGGAQRGGAGRVGADPGGAGPEGTDPGGAGRA